MSAPSEQRVREFQRIGNLEIAAVSDIGTVRAENQDGWSIVPLPDGSCGFFVADGMGGHARGGEAANTALAAASVAVARGESLAQAFEAADRAVAEMQGPIGSARDVAGTTLVGAITGGSQLAFGNVGDSRAYIVRGGELRQITDDHSAAGELVRAGRLTAEQGATYPGRNMLTRAVTGGGDRADLFDDTFAAGDVVMLCSDGVWGAMSDGQLLEAMVAETGVEAMAERLCDAALAAGSADNVTVLVCRRI